MINIAVNKVEGSKDSYSGKPVVLQISGKCVVGTHALEWEEPFTLWRGGTAVLCGDSDGSVCAVIDGMVVDERHYSLDFPSQINQQINQ